MEDWQGLGLVLGIGSCFGRRPLDGDIVWPIAAAILCLYSSMIFSFLIALVGLLAMFVTLGLSRLFGVLAGSLACFEESWGPSGGTFRQV